MKLYFVRHGETTANHSGIMLGHLNGELTSKGIEQAESVGEFLINESFDIIYSSDLNRAVQTTDAISKFQSDVPIVYTSDLRERYLGKYQGESKSKFGWNKSFQVYSLGDSDIESRTQILGRARNFLDFLLEHNSNDVVLIVSHSAFGKAFLGVIRKHSAVQILETSKLNNASIITIKPPSNII